MKLKPVHLLSGVLWLNFLALCWSILLGYVDAGAMSGIMLFMFFVMSAGTSMTAFEARSVKSDDRK